MGAAICLLSGIAIAFQAAFWHLQGRWIDLPLAAAWRLMFGDVAVLAPMTPLTAARRAFELYLALDPECGRARS